MTSPSPTHATDVAMTIVFGVSVLGLADSLFNYLSPGNGIHGSEGALLVVVSTALMALASGLLARGWIKGWVGGVFEVLLGLDFFGTAIAAYFLEAWILLALVALAALAWALHLARPVRRTASFPHLG